MIGREYNWQFLLRLPVPQKPMLCPKPKLASHVCSINFDKLNHFLFNCLIYTKVTFQSTLWLAWFSLIDQLSRWEYIVLTETILNAPLPYKVPTAATRPDKPLWQASPTGDMYTSLCEISIFARYLTAFSAALVASCTGVYSVPLTTHVGYRTHGQWQS